MEFTTYDEKDFQSKSFGDFGLNKGKINNIDYIKEENGNYFYLEVFVKDTVYKDFIFDPTGKDLYFNGELISQSDENYEEVLEKNIKEKLAVITHILKATGATSEDFKEEFKTPAKSFEEWVKRAIKLKGKEERVDIFLEYQYSLKEGNTMTFLQIPKNLKGGYFIIPETEGNWQEKRENDKLFYVNEKEEEHPFKRNSNFMNSTKANQIKLNKKEEEDIPDTSSDTW